MGGGGRVRRQNIQGAGFDNFLLDEFRSYDSKLTASINIHISMSIYDPRGVK